MKAKIRLTDEKRKAELMGAFNVETNARMRIKLKSIELAYTGDYTMTQIAGLVGRARSGVAEYIRRFRVRGVEALRPKVQSGVHLRQRKLESVAAENHLTDPREVSAGYSSDERADTFFV